MIRILNKLVLTRICNTVFVGMLSKSKGQILRVAAVMQVLFHWENPHNIPNDITDEALKASINFVEVCIQHTAYLAERPEIEAVESIQKMLLGRL